MLICSYIAVLQMESQRPSQLMSISSKYPSLPAAHGDGAALPSVLTGIIVARSASPWSGGGGWSQLRWGRTALPWWQVSVWTTLTQSLGACWKWGACFTKDLTVDV